MKKPNAFDAPLVVLIEQYKEDILLGSLMLAKRIAQDEYKSRLVNRLDALVWARIGELQR